MMGFAKIAGGAPSAVRPMVTHLLNATLRPEQSRLAAYYALGMVQPDQDVPLSNRDRRNEQHFESWVAGKVKPDLVRLAEYALMSTARFSPGEIGQLLRQDLERGLAAAQREEEPPRHGTQATDGSWEPAPEHLRALSAEALQNRLSRLIDQWSEAMAAADAKASLGTAQDPNAPIAVVRPDLHPMVALGLGIEPSRRLTSDQVEALLAGRRSDGELIEGKNYAKPRRLPVDPKTGEERYSGPIGSYDFSTSADKSVSVAWAFANPAEQARIYNAHVQASRDAVGYMADRVGQARMGDGGKDGAEPGHVAWLEFTHHTARRTQFAVANGAIVVRTDNGTPGDPDLHTHHLMPNAVFTDSGRVGSLDTAAVPGFLFEAGAVYQMRLAQYLNDEGFEIALDPKTGAAVMPAIPEDVRTLFSKRTSIGELLARTMTAERGEDWDLLSADQREARLKNATQDLDQRVKGGKDDVANFDDWKRQAKEVCRWEAPETLRAPELYTVELSPEMKRQIAYEHALPMLDERFQAKSVIQHFEPRIAAARSMIVMGGGSLEDIDAITARMREFGVRQYGEQTPLLWGIEDGKRYTSVTTGLHEAEENEFIRLAKAAGDDRSGALPAELLREKIALSGLVFSGAHGAAQRAAIERVGSGGRFELIVAAAGAGKTTALTPLVAAWHDQGRTVYGASLAWRQADDLTQAGIGARNKFAFAVLVDAIKDGENPDRDSPYPPLKLDRNSVIAIDEFGLLGTRQGLELLRLQAKHAFSIVALGDDKQCTAVQAGATIDLARRALGAARVPEILTTRRQQTERERMIVGLFREGRAAEALDMKRADRTAEMVPGGYDGVVSRVAKLYAQRLQATGEPPTIAAPTNIDAHRISEAVRLQRRGMGLMGETDLMTLRATDGERNYSMPIAKGDRVRLFQSTGADFGEQRGGNIGRNGSILEVVAADRDGITLKSRSGKVGKVEWQALEAKGRVKLAYGHAMTIHTAQGSTSKEHILALPSGSRAIDGTMGYSGGTRHRQVSYLLTNEAAEREDVRKRRPLNDTREITLNDRWANVARTLAYQPEKDTAVALFDRVGRLRRGSVREFQRAMPDVHRAAQPELSPAQEVVERRTLDIALEHARIMVHQVVERMRQIPTQLMDRLSPRQEHRISRDGPSPGR